jgi:two-component sensor histidine kinase
MVGTLADISERRAAEDRLRGALREKEVLLREVHHRVKNNLQVVASLLGLQGRAAGEPRARELFEESAARVSSMAMAHEQLYRSADLSSIDFASYLRQLARHLSARAGRRDIVVDLRAQPCTLSLEVAVPCGLICNELLSNAFRHAFPGGRSGSILLETGATPDGGLLLAVADDGVGFPDGFRPEEASSLGWRMISSLAHQLGGHIRIPSRSPVRVEWEVPRHRQGRGFQAGPEAEAGGAPSTEGEGA